MSVVIPMVMSLAVSLGIGLLIGAERERHKNDDPARSTAGIRTFAVTALAGAVSKIVGGDALAGITVGGIAVLAALGYWRSRGDDPGLTTEMTLLLAALLGALSVAQPALAAGAGVIVAVLLATRTPLHRFVRIGFSDAEARDALILASAALVVLPLLPDRTVGPFNALNPHAIWLVVVLVLAIGAAGHVAVRLLGERYGLPLAGLASGFVSSVATIGAMGGRARKSPSALPGAVAGALLSTLATVVQMAAVVGVTSIAALQALAPSLVAAGAAAAVYGAVFTFAAVRALPHSKDAQSPRAFSLTGALAFALTVAAVVFASAGLRTWYGNLGVLVAAVLAGFVDTHSAAISVATLVADGKLTPSEAVAPILAGFATNTISKLGFAVISGGRPFALRVAPGLALVAAAAGAGALVALR